MKKTNGANYCSRKTGGKSYSQRNCGSNAKMKTGKATGPCKVNVERIVATGKIGVKVMMGLCRGGLDG